MVEARDLTLILARDLASKLATPFFLVDPGGALIFYNEPAERILGKRFGETGELSQQEWGRMFTPVSASGEPIPVEELPLSIALAERRAAHLPVRITGLDGVERAIGVTAFPLMPHAEELVGAIAIFWEEGS